MTLLFSFFFSCFKSGSPFKTIAIGLIATVLLSSIGVVAYKLYTSSSKIEHLTTQVAEVTKAATVLQTTVKDTDASMVVNDAAETTQIAVETKTVQHHNARQHVMKKRIDAIVNDKTLPVAEKEEDLSRVYVTSILAEYCGSAAVDQSYCKNVTTPDTTVTPSLTMSDSLEQPVSDLNTPPNKDLQ